MHFIKSYKNTIIYIATILFSIVFIIAGYNINKTNFNDESYQKSYKAQVISIEDKKVETLDYGYESMSSTTIKFKAKISDDDIEESTIEAIQYIDENIAVNPKEIEPGDNILLSSLLSRTGEEEVWTFIEYDRSNILIWLLISFFVLLIIFGHKKGVNTIISLIFTCLAIFMVFVPSILKGNNIYLNSTIVSIFIIFMNLLIINGANKKTLCAIIGNLGGLFIAGLFALIISKFLHLTGLIDEESMFLLMINPDKPIDLIAILWSSIVIGSLGAVMDVSMSIASAMNELSENMINKNFKTMLKSGLNIGQDAIGTMTNTLILAYIGSSLSVVLLLVVNYKDILLLFNLEMIVFEVMQAIIGSMGILFAIPITSFFAAYVYNHNNKNFILSENELKK
ncbi:YibE/F family protein [Sedimentibacter sp. MB31-C6]|uniref:YibE/F family protein n=1 Tax=Sedimentibacter sp. MB31-C6 TaxID=3109366 RepID=UPI002DDCCA40|nr:YibE/F family protein [Sedimentibacter sp. MB36-C1]WSI03000.1 YibE/F family protein [Sedimentibacter sp. MB36-C1]